MFRMFDIKCSVCGKQMVCEVEDQAGCFVCEDQLLHDEAWEMQMELRHGGIILEYMTTEQIVESCKRFCLTHYEDWGHWWIETYTQEDWVDHVHGMKYQAFIHLERVGKIREDYANDIRNA